MLTARTSLCRAQRVAGKEAAEALLRDLGAPRSARLLVISTMSHLWPQVLKRQRFSSPCRRASP